MTMEEKMLLASKTAQQLHELLAKPEPGLITWWMMLAQTYEQLKNELIALPSTEAIEKIDTSI